MFKRFSLLALLMVGLFAYLFVGSSPRVVALSDGCERINADDFFRTTVEPEIKAVMLLLAQDFEAGEVIRYSANGVGTEGIFGIGISMITPTDEFIETVLQETVSDTPINISGTVTIPETARYFIVFGARTTGIGSTLEYSLTCSEAIPGGSPDNRVNYGYGDVFTVAYSPFVDGAHNLDLYCADGIRAFSITPSQVTGLTPTADAQLIESVADGTCNAEFYLLSTGEYQINIYVPEGKIYTLIDTDLDFHDASKSYFDPNE